MQLSKVYEVYHKQYSAFRSGSKNTDYNSIAMENIPGVFNFWTAIFIPKRAKL